VRPIHRHLEIDDRVMEITVDPDDDGATVCIDDGEAEDISLPACADRYALRWGGRTWLVTTRREGNAVEVAVDGARFRVTPTAGRPAGAAAGAAGPVKSPMPGKVVELTAVVGAAVARGDVVAVVEAMKLRTSLTAGCDGVVTAVQCALDDQVTAGQVLVEIEEGTDD